MSCDVALRTGDELPTIDFSPRSFIREAVIKDELNCVQDTDGAPQQQSPNSGGSAAQSPSSVAGSHSSVAGSPQPVVSAALAPMLPPCRICGEKASGFHYGANTCEACKGFFRRCLSRKDHSFNCVGSGNCEITPHRRSMCSYCRWKKCLDSGMSKSAIKTGRYTHEKKTRDIREVKRLQEVAKLKKEGRYTEDMIVKHEPEDLEKIIKHITDVHMQHTPHTPEFFAKLPQKEKEFLEQRELQQKMFGTMRPIPREEYMQIYQTTGIDVDGRKEMIKHMIPCIEKSIKRFIAFAKALPGFKDLPIDDQIALIKASRLESWLISAHQAFNREQGLFTEVCGYTLDVTEMVKVHKGDHLENLFLAADKIKKLNLTMEEICVFRAICILQSDRVKLLHPVKVDAAQNLLLAAMKYLVRRNHAGVRHFLPRLVSIMTELRTLTELHRHWEETINMDWSSEFKIPPLLYEIASV